MTRTVKEMIDVNTPDYFNDDARVLLETVGLVP